MGDGADASNLMDASSGAKKSSEASGSNFKFIRELKGHDSSIASVRFKPDDGRILLSASADQTVRMWNPETGELLHTLMGHKAGLNDVAWSHDGRFFASASDDHTISIWDTEKAQVLNTLKGHTNFVFSVKFNPAGNMMVSGSFDETVRGWDTRSCQAIRQLPAHSDPVTSVDVNRDGTLIMSSSFDGLIRIWDASNGKCLKTIMDEDSSPLSFAEFTPNGKYLLVMALNGRMMLKEAETNEVKRDYEGHQNKHYCLVPTITNTSGLKGNRLLVSGSEDNSIYIWDIHKRRKGGPEDAGKKKQNIIQPIQKIEGGQSKEAPGTGHTDVVLCVGAHPSKTMFASGAKDKDSTIRLYADTEADA